MEKESTWHVRDQLKFAKVKVEYRMRKLIEQYNKRGLSVNIEKTKYIYIETEACHLIVNDHQSYIYKTLIKTPYYTEQKLGIKLKSARTK